MCLNGEIYLPWATSLEDGATVLAFLILLLARLEYLELSAACVGMHGLRYCW